MMQDSPIVIIGLGQLGGLFSTGFLRLGCPVYPVLRDDHPAEIAARVDPLTVLAAVGEADLPHLLRRFPDVWKDRLTLLSNELLPATWQAFAIRTPTVISVQFEKKPGQPVLIDRPSPVFGPQADLIIRALEKLSISAIKIEGLEAMTRELVLKNLYILTLNLGGLATHATAREMLDQHRDLIESIWTDLFAVQQGMVDISLDSEALMLKTMEYLALAPERRAGRSAVDRLERTLQLAQGLEIQMPTLASLNKEISL